MFIEGGVLHPLFLDDSKGGCPAPPFLDIYGGGCSAVPLSPPEPCLVRHCLVASLRQDAFQGRLELVDAVLELAALTTQKKPLHLSYQTALTGDLKKFTW